VFGSVAASPDDVRRALPGDHLVPDADIVMDRAFDLAAPPEAVWPWFLQLGKKRAGWYLPRFVERSSRPRAAACAGSTRRSSRRLASAR
jgi:hypothetical protein